LKLPESARVDYAGFISLAKLLYWAIGGMSATLTLVDVTRFVLFASGDWEEVWLADTTA
jgi:hypothetical protein